MSFMDAKVAYMGLIEHLRLSQEDLIKQVKELKKYLCIQGLSRHLNEKDMIKFLRKTFAGGEGKPPLEKIPLTSISKKRGKNVGFLQFSDMNEKKEFKLLFNKTVKSNKRIRLREITRLDERSRFRPVKTKEEMAADSMRRREENFASVTQADVDEVLALDIEKRVTPYAKIAYPEQLKRKH